MSPKLTWNLGLRVGSTTETRTTLFRQMTK